MHIRTVCGSVILSVAAFLVLNSCDSNPSVTTPTVKSTLTAEEQQDLVKMATIITGIMTVTDLSPQGSTGQGLSKQRSDYSYECDNSKPGTISCTYQHEYGTDIDTISYFTDATKTAPIDNISAISPGSYYYIEYHMISIDSTTAVDMFMKGTDKMIDYSLFTDITDSLTAWETMYTTMESSNSFTGTMDYYKDDLQIEFYDCTGIMKAGIMKGDYRLGLMMGKYSVSMQFEISWKDLYGDTSVSSPVIQGPIINSSGEQIGLFTVSCEDGSVAIYDNQGNLVKTAG